MLKKDKILESYKDIDNVVEISESLTKQITGIRNDKQIGYMELFNLTVKPIKQLTFYEHTGDNKYRKMLHSYQALTSFLFTESDFDYVLFVQGLEGIGKSTYCISIIDELRKLGKEFNYNDHMITKSWEYNEVEDLLSDVTNSVIFFDEGKKFFDLRRSMHPERVDMLEYFTTERWRKNIYIMAVSDLTEIDKYFRERRAKAITLLPDRGLAFMLHSVNLFGVGQDRFFLERFEQMISNNTMATNFEKQLAMIMDLPTCYGVGFTERKTGGDWDEYYNLKIKHNEKKDAKTTLKEFIEKE